MFLLERAYAYRINLPFPGQDQEISSFNEYIIQLIGFAINVGFALAVLVILYGAIKYTSGAGDEAKAKDSKDIILGAVIGFALLVLIRVIIPILGLQ